MKNRLAYSLLWSFEKPEFGSFSADVPVTTINGTSKPRTVFDRNGLEYYSPVNFESIDTHFGIVPLGYHMGGMPWTHMIT